MSTYTPKARLAVSDFEQVTWHDDVNGNWYIIDGLFNYLIRLQNFRGIWQNSTLYTEDDHVLDNVNGVMYKANVTHVSSALPTTFAQERLLHPTYWQVAGLGISFGGVWEPDTFYFANTFLVYGSKYLLTLIDHVSSPTTPDPDIAAEKIMVLIEFSGQLPPVIGQAEKYIRINALGTDFEYRSPIEVLEDIQAEYRDAKGTLASATTVNIGAVTTRYIEITGSNPISSFGVAPAGTRRLLQFLAPITVEHNPALINLPGNADLIITAPTLVEFVCVDGTVWKPVSPEPLGVVAAASIAVLRAAAPTASGNITLLGYYAPGDGGGGDFYWDAASVEADNNGTIIETSASATGRWKRTIVGAVNVLWFGADKSATQQSDVAFQDAQDYVSSLGGGTIFAPPGEYIIGAGTASTDTTIVVASHTTWTAVPGTVRLHNRGRSPKMAGCFQLEGTGANPLEDVTIDGFIIDGQQQVRTAATGIGVLKNIAFKRCVFHDHINFSIAYGGSEFDPDEARYESWTFDECRLTGFSGGTALGSGIDLFPKAFDPDTLEGVSFGFRATNCHFDLRYTPGELLVAPAGTLAWVNTNPYAVGARVAGLGADANRLYYCIVTDGAAPGAAPTGTASVIDTGDGYKWGYMGDLGTVIGPHAPEPDSWLPSTSYTVLGTEVLMSSLRVYELITAGTSAASGGPGSVAGQETNADITDGTAHWRYVGVRRNRIKTTPINGGSGYHATTEARIIRHNNLSTGLDAILLITIVGGVVTNVAVDPANKGTTYSQDCALYFYDPTFSGRGATFGDPGDTLFHGTVGIKLSNARGAIIENFVCRGGAQYPLNLTNGLMDSVVRGLRVTEAATAMGINGGLTAFRRKWVICSTDVDIANNTIQMRDSPGGGVINHGLVDGDLVTVRTSDEPLIYPTILLPAPLVADELYYVVNSTATLIKLALTPGGTAIDITTIGDGHFMVGKATGIGQRGIAVSDVYYERAGVKNASGQSFVLGGALTDVTLDTVDIERSIALRVFRVTDGMIRLKLDKITIRDGNILVDPRPGATYITRGVVDGWFGVISIRGGTTGTGRILLNDSQLPCFNCTFDQLSFDNFFGSALVIAGEGNHVRKVTARGGNNAGTGTNPIVVNQGRNNKFGPIISAVPRKGIAAWVTLTAYAVGDLYYTFVGSQKRFYRVTKAGTSGATPPSATTGTIVDGDVNAMFLWANSSTHFFQDSVGLGGTVLTAFEGECIDIADGVAGKPTRFLLLENQSGSVAGGKSVPFSEVSTRQATFPGLTMAADDHAVWDASIPFIVLGWQAVCIIAASADAGVALRAGIIDTAGAANTTYFGSLTSIVSDTIGKVQCVVNTTGGDFFANRLLPAGAQLTLGNAGGKLGVGGYRLRAQLIPWL